MHPTPVQVEPRGGQRLWLRYSDGVSGELDLSALADLEQHAAWRDRDFFDQVRIDEYGEIVWTDAVRLCPDRLYAELQGISLDEQDARWDAELADAPQTPPVAAVEPRAGYRIWLRYQDGVDGEIDLADIADTEICKPWREQAFFERVHVNDGGAVAWNDDIELCPDSLYAELLGVTLEDLLAGATPSAARIPARSHRLSSRS